MPRQLKTLFAFVSILALCGVTAFAETLDFPNKGDLLFRITIPDDWEPDQDDDEVVEATSPDEHLSLSIWELDSKDDAKNIEQELKDQLKDHAKKIKIDGKPQEAHPGGLDGMLYQGTAVDKEDDEPIDFFALVITTKTRAAVVFIEADREAPKEEVAQLDLILKSITPPGGKILLRAALALDKDTRRTKKFTTDAPQIYAFYVGLALKEGDELKGAWLADDVGDAAPKNSKIGEASIKAKTATDSGAFSLSKPTNGWPPGKYRIEISVNDKVVEKLKFTIAEP
jgi:hypothetical protein